MKALIRCFFMFLRHIAKDRMLFAVLAAPLLAGSAFRFGIPAAERLLCDVFDKTSILAGYYQLFDLFLLVMTPYMICFTSAMVMLSELDENMAAYLAVTPVGKWGYILSRLVFPAILSTPAAIVITLFFSLSDWHLPTLVLGAFLSGFMSIGIALLIVAFSHNRIEGMALAKLAGIVLLGLPVPFFLTSGTQYLFLPLPSFWLAKLCVEASGLWFAVPALLTSLLWMGLLYGRFSRKLS